MWEIISIDQDSLICSRDIGIGNTPRNQSTKPDALSYIVSSATSIASFLGNDPSALSSFHEGGKGSCVALADFASRHFLAFHERNITTETIVVNEDGNVENNHRRHISIHLETLDEGLLKKRQRRKRKGQRLYPPYVVERSDFFCCDGILRINVCVIIQSTSKEPLSKERVKTIVSGSCQSIFRRVFSVDDPTFQKCLLEHISCVALQQRLRSHLLSIDAIAFISDGSILPRKSGASFSPMASPPAVAFKAPPNSRMSTSISIDMGSLIDYVSTSSLKIESIHKSTVVLSGLVVLQGVTLICGGGYHGKSTTLQAIAVGQYDKISGDGREFCVSVPDAVTVRAEDGRYVNNCNISAFISNLPTPPGVNTPLDTQHFSTRDSSGSTSQATNVVEAIEFGATCLLVDEDISAANFMARDGRMRSLVMDESITPLLYRVNGLYNVHKISSIIVVGGVGDWLDVPHNVILLDKYMVYDATKKARSISNQFSYGHVQYAGRGVVHRLEWDKEGMPIPRRPTDAFSRRFDSDVNVSLLNSGCVLSLYKEDVEDDDADESTNQIVITIDDDDDDDEEEEGCIEASRMEQLLGRRQFYAVGFCVAWILQNAPMKPKFDLKSLLHLLDSVLDNGGMNLILNKLSYSNSSLAPTPLVQVIQSVGFLERPRGVEIGQALTRMYGIQFEEIPMYDDGSDETSRLEEQNKRKALAELWASRRSRSN